MAESDPSTQESTRNFTAVVSLLRQAESLLSGGNSGRSPDIQSVIENTRHTGETTTEPNTSTMSPLADRALSNFRQLFAPYNKRQPSPSLRQGRARVLATPASKGRKSNSRTARSFVVKDTWTHEFFCLASHVQNTQPSRRDKLSLQDAGLGRKTIAFGRNDDALAFMAKIETVYPKIKSGGGFELLRSGATNKELVVICPPLSGYAVPFLRESSGIGQALIYVRPLQKSLEINTVALLQDLPCSSSDCPKVQCILCGINIPVTEVRLHQLVCGGGNPADKESGNETDEQKHKENCVM